MAQTFPHVPVEVYLRSSYEPDAEYVDGQIDPETKDYYRFEHGELHKASVFGDDAGAMRFEISEVEKLLD